MQPFWGISLQKSITLGHRCWLFFESRRAWKNQYHWFYASISAKRVQLFQLLHFFDILWITEVRSIHFAFSCLLSTTTTLIFYNLFSILNFLIHMKQYISYLSFRCIIFSLPRFCLHFRHIRSHTRCRSRKIILMLSKFQIFSIFKFQLLSILTQKWCS